MPIITNFEELLERLEEQRLDHIRQAGAMLACENESEPAIMARQMAFIAKLDALNTVIDEVNELWRGPNLSRENADD
jgi:hypothetical protein